MKTAKEMFEELGWELNFQSKAMITYIKKSRSGKTTKYVRFFLGSKTFDTGTIGAFAQPFTMQELQAINKQCKELGWL